MHKKVPHGIELLSYIYAVNLCFYLLSLVLFYNLIIIAGHQADALLSSLVRFFFILVPIYLFFRLRRLKADAWFLAVYFHLFSLFNNCLYFLEYLGASHALIRISGVYSSGPYSFKQGFVLAVSTQLHFVIVAYLLKVRKFYF